MLAGPSHAKFLVAAPDQAGLVARLAGFFADLGLNILDASNHTDAHGAGQPRFYMRLVVDLAGLEMPAAHASLGESVSRRSLENAFARLASRLDATWSVRYSDRVAKVAVLVTKEATCLYDLLLRQQSGELPCEIPLVVSNHPTLESVAESFRTPFFVLPVTPETRGEQEDRILELLRRHHIDLVVLARYMQVLTDGFLGAAPPIINIHHGFLPAFQGAKPYHQAHARGVKMIGATAHYATADLDQGPILEQDVARVNHRMGPEEMARVGRDVERIVLARGVRAHLEHRVIVEGQRTILL
ncbi:MAG TPA: formyltetrahydrofolate deformylase [Polyangiaceae bacterium]|nr:formyltetrahydrofolate deformylase [Polyangiaceae bacterium]